MSVNRRIGLYEYESVQRWDLPLKIGSYVYVQGFAALLDHPARCLFVRLFSRVCVCVCVCVYARIMLVVMASPLSVRRRSEAGSLSTANVISARWRLRHCCLSVSYRATGRVHLMHCILADASATGTSCAVAVTQLASFCGFMVNLPTCQLADEKTRTSDNGHVVCVRQTRAVDVIESGRRRSSVDLTTSV